MKLHRVSFLLSFSYAGLCRSSPVQQSFSLHSKRDDTPAASPMLQLSSDPTFHYEILRDMAIAPYEGADIGELLIAAKDIKASDFDSYYNVFNRLATRVHNEAKAIDARKHWVSARNAYFKASTYYRSADFFLHGNWSDPRIDSLWEQWIAAFDAAIALLPNPGQRMNLRAKNGNFSIPIIFYRSGLPGPRPTLLLGNGYDGGQEEMYHVMGQAALQRGMNVITYEGPGQPTVRRRQNLGFIPEWDEVVTPIIDYAVTRPEVQADSIGIMGYSFGGYLAPRAAAVDHRIAAVLALDGVDNFGTTVLHTFPKELVEIYKSGNASYFNALLTHAIADPKTSSSARWAVQQGMWSFNIKTPFEFVTAAQQYNMTDFASKIKVPVFVGSAENDQFFPGQAKALADRLGKLATYHEFKSVDGAGEHCSVGGNVLVNQVALDWLEDVFSRRTC